MASYNPASPYADEFINHEEILQTLAYAQQHKDDLELCRAILRKAQPNTAPKKEHCACITHREAAVLLACEDPQINEEIKQLKMAQYHKVRQGDTLSGIARKYHTSVRTLCRLNRIKETSILRLGQKIRVR